MKITNHYFNFVKSMAKGNVNTLNHFLNVSFDYTIWENIDNFEDFVSEKVYFEQLNDEAKEHWETIKYEEENSGLISIGGTWVERSDYEDRGE